MEQLLSLTPVLWPFVTVLATADTQIIRARLARDGTIFDQVFHLEIFLVNADTSCLRQVVQ